MIGLLETALQSGLSFDPEIEPVHLVFKWNTSREANPVGRHKAVSDELGAVWWGRFGESGSGIGARNLAQLQSQLDASIPTHVYLYRRGEVWRTVLHEITTDRERIERDRLPSYYEPSECNLFVLISEFEEVLPPDWIESHLVKASDPDPEKTVGVLSNQTTPLFMYELFDVGSGDHRQSRPPVHLPLLTIEWLEEETLWERPALEDLIEALTDETPQILLAGPPGTGKTWVANRVGRFITNDQPLALRIVQFHPSYGYEEFVEGLRPVIENGAVNFSRVDGVVLDIVKQLEDPTDRAVLVIDEMNRANLPRVFGELLYLLEYRDHPINLLYTRDFELPRGLALIGTMNTADRSIRSIDTALRRRFDIFECPPSRAILERWFQNHENDVSDLLDGFETLNGRLEEQLGRHYLVGHTFFMHAALTPERLNQIWARQLLPLIEEYFFDQPDLALTYIAEELWPSLSRAD
jgi:hypothetical protein